MKILMSLGIVAFCITLTFCQRNFDNVEIKTTKVAEGIYMMEGSGGNLGVFVGEDCTLLIDDQFAPLSEKIKNAIAELSDNPVKYLVNTHWHGDHTGGNENFGNDGAIIVAHDNVRTRLSTSSTNASGQTRPAAPEAAWPQITFNETVSLHINGDNVSFIHVHNAHTDGDAFVYFSKGNVLHMGDCFFNGRFPYIDLNSGGSVKGALKAIEVALMLIDDNTKIIPGHGQLSDKKGLKEYQSMLSELLNRTVAAMKSGKTLEEAKAMNLTRGFESYDGGFINKDRIIDIIWTDLSSGE